MAQDVSSSETSIGTEGIGGGWRVFQFVALVVAVSWIVSYFAMGGYESLLTGSGRGIDMLGAYIFGLSPVISLIVLLLAVAPDKLAFLSGTDTTAIVGRLIVLGLPLLWMINVFIGTPMIDKLITDPLGQSRAVPVFAGVFFHVVFQHWFQALTGIVLALVPDQFATLTESPTPAGIQCAVIDCE